MKRLIFLLLFLIIPVFLILSPLIIEARDEAALQKELAYLNGIPEVSWVEFDENNVYIGFNIRPSDLRLITNAAALIGNKAYGFGVHIWAVNAKHKGWRPGDGPYYCTATARRGKIKKNTCR